MPLDKDLMGRLRGVFELDEFQRFINAFVPLQRADRPKIFA